MYCANLCAREFVCFGAFGRRRRLGRQPTLRLLCDFRKNRDMHYYQGVDSYQREDGIVGTTGFKHFFHLPKNSRT